MSVSNLASAWRAFSRLGDGGLLGGERVTEAYLCRFCSDLLDTQHLGRGFFFHFCNFSRIGLSQLIKLQC